MIAGLLGILKSGAAYIPMDPDYPDDRLSFYLEDAKAGILLTQKELWNSFSGFRENSFLESVIYLDNNLECVKKELKENPESSVTPQNLAYILYTSGSTGKPKGVAIEHHSPCALISWGQDIYSKEELSGALASTSICFDVSVYEIFVTLCSGGRLILIQNALKLPEIKRSEDITLINTVPSAAKQLVQINGIPENVQTINLAGEPLPRSLVDKLYEIENIKKVYDLYGPSEDTTYSTFTLRKKGGINTIGKPLHNTQVYILDKNLAPVPAGVAGELHISGQGLARGYLNRPELTAEKFIPNPFTDDPDSRLYKTGDLASWFPDGNIKFLGRIDFQVKIRGFRIELSEIQAVLLKHPFVKENVVAAKEDKKGDKLLIAYIEKNENYDDKSKDMSAELKIHLSKKLPDYMIPSFFMFMDSLPLTPNGKIDRKSLPEPDLSLIQKEYAGPVTEKEKILSKIWEETLVIERIGIHDNFFSIGGDSIISIQIISRAAEKGLFLTVKQIFEHQTIAQLAMYAETKKQTTSYQGRVTGDVQLTPVMKHFF
jgi:amino acid adenylation domain-containing protein